MRGADNSGPEVESAFGHFNVNVMMHFKTERNGVFCEITAAKYRLIIHCGSVLHAAGAALIYTWLQLPSGREEIRSTFLL